MGNDYYEWIALDLIARRLEREGKTRKARRVRRKANKALIRAGGMVLEV